jgi:hypothetical protein
MSLASIPVILEELAGDGDWAVVWVPAPVQAVRGSVSVMHEMLIHPSSQSQLVRPIEKLAARSKAVCNARESTVEVRTVFDYDVAQHRGSP